MPTPATSFVIPFVPGGIMVMNLLIVVGWVIFSFLFWRGLRLFAVDEDRVFDLTFYSTLVAFVAGRAGFVVTHGDLFFGKSLLLVVALWVAPGLSWLCGFVGGVATLVLLSRQYKVRLGLVLDALAVALPLPIILGEAGSFLTASELGRPAIIPWAIRVSGTTGDLRHPVQFYTMISLIILSFIILRLTTISTKHKWPYGLVGVWFFLLYAVSGFVLEFFKDSRVYWGNLTANQWMLIGIFAECVGVLYIRGGGREKLRPFFTRLGIKAAHIRKGIYEFVSRRHAFRSQKTS